MKKNERSKWTALTRQGLAFVLVAVMLLGYFLPGGVQATEDPTDPTAETTAPAAEETTATEPEGTTAPTETQPEETTAPAEPEETRATEPRETEPKQTAYERIMEDLTALEEEVKTLEAMLEVLDPFYERLIACVDAAQLLWENDEISNDEMNAINEKAQAIVKYLKDEYGYENGAIGTMSITPITNNTTLNATVKMFNYDESINIHPQMITNAVEGKSGNARGEYWFVCDEAQISYTVDTKTTKPPDSYAVATDTHGQDLIHTNNRYRTGTTAGRTSFSVASNLTNGYPVITAWPNAAEVAAGTDSSIIYGSMAYLFDEGNGYYINKMTDGGGLFQLGADGYYEYDSAKNAAYYDAEENRFTLYDAVLRPYYLRDTDNNLLKSNFLPFNDPATSSVISETTTTSGKKSYALDQTELAEMWFGMTVEFDFAMLEGGLVNGEPMTFEFDGDDDVLVFVDDVLILDIAGCHSSQSASVDFSTGVISDQRITQSGYAPDATTTIKARFEQAGEDTSAFNNNTFADYTSHTLKFFYLERGAGNSACKLRFNMPTLPDNSLSVSKSVKNDTNPNAKKFNFKVELTDASNNPLTKVDYTKNNGTVQEMTLENGVGYFELYNNDMVTFDLSAGVKYKVTELSANQNGYVTTDSGNTEGSLNGPPVLVNFTNTLQTGGIERDKYVTEGDELGEYTITLEAYATGQISSVSNTKPADIVLVVDHSGSMLRAMDANQKLKSTDLDTVKGAKKGYYIAQGEENVFFLLYQDGKWMYYLDKTRATKQNALNWNDGLAQYAFSNNGENHLFEEVTQDMWDILDNGEGNIGIYQTRYGATYDALMTFVNNTVATAKEDNIEHRIALVGFAGDANDGNRIYNGANFTSCYSGKLTADYDYKAAFKSVLNTNDVADIYASVNAIFTRYGYTDTVRGIELGNRIFNASPIDPAGSRSRVMIVMTDGKASLEEERLNELSTFDEATRYDESSRLAVVEANRTKKEMGATVYVVGALSKDETLAMWTSDRISSNFTDATTFDDGTKTNSKYYSNAFSSEGLTNIFETIVTDMSGTQVQLNQYAVLRDQLSQYFQLDDTDGRKIKVYTAECEGVDDDGNFIFKDRVEWTEGTELTDGEAEDHQLEVTIKPAADGTNLKNATIDVTGFNYSKYYVAATTENDGRGRKIIVEVPIKIDSDNLGGNKQPTNIKDDSGIYEDPTKPDPVIDFPLPHVDTPAKVYVKKVVTGNMGDRSQMFSFTSTGQKYVKSEGKYYESEDDSQVGNSNYLYAGEKANYQTETNAESFQLKHDQTHTITELYDGSNITIKEADAEGYTVTITYEDEEIAAEANADGEIRIKVEPGMTITFTNDKEVTIDTGVVLDSLPYILILVGVAAVGVILFVRKRRIED